MNLDYDHRLLFFKSVTENKRTLFLSRQDVSVYYLATITYTSQNKKYIDKLIEAARRAIRNDKAHTYGVPYRTSNKKILDGRKTTY